MSKKDTGLLNRLNYLAQRFNTSPSAILTAAEAFMSVVEQPAPPAAAIPNPTSHDIMPPVIEPRPQKSKGTSLAWVRIRPEPELNSLIDGACPSDERITSWIRDTVENALNRDALGFQPKRLSQSKIPRNEKADYSVSIDGALLEKIDAARAKTRISRAAVVIQILQHELTKSEPKPLHTHEA